MAERGKTPRGSFIAFEGIDGSGKSTQIARLKRRLEREGVPCRFTREPTDLPVGALIRRILSGEERSDGRVTAALFVADRLDHLLRPGEGLLETIERGVPVVTDRYYFSSYAYQSVDLPMDWIISANAPSAELLRPDVNLFIDMDPDEALRRITRSRSQIELYETRERLTAVRARYAEAMEKLRDTENVVIVDGNLAPDALEAEIWKQIRGYFQ